MNFDDVKEEVTNLEEGLAEDTEENGETESNEEEREEGVEG